MGSAHMPKRALIGALLIANMLTATRLSFSIQPLVRRTPTDHQPVPPIVPFSSHCSAPSMATVPQSTPEVNPLLLDFDFPPFDAVKADHVIPGIRTMLNQLENDLIELESKVEPTWPKLVDPLEKLVDRLSVVWGIVNHLKSVKDSSELRSAIEEVQPDKVKFELRLGQSKPIYNAFKAIQESPEWQTLSDAQKRIVDCEYTFSMCDLMSPCLISCPNKAKQFLAVFSLEDDKKEHFNKIQQGHKDATAENGPWIITLDVEIWIIRKIIGQILKLRLEKAKLLGYSNYAEVSMATKMATVDKAEELLEKLRSASWDAAVQDTEDLKNFSKSQGAVEADDLSHWDLNFWSERLRESKYDINEDHLLMVAWQVDAPKLAGSLRTGHALFDQKLMSAANPLGPNSASSPSVSKICSIVARLSTDALGIFPKMQNQVHNLIEIQHSANVDIIKWKRNLFIFCFKIQQEELRPYFSLPKVMGGLFSLAKMLLELTLSQLMVLAPVWNNDVRFYCVKDTSGSPIAYFYFDPYSRPSEKRGGAWMDEVVARSRALSRDGTKARLPIAHMCAIKHHQWEINQAL
ncbi:putative cytosolic oligopeptidase A [Vitis vinifera]|uniref:Putative cytosolic oligopeptidase A n=1 Tax=Vitis vinifera TaxID=29760 RepID=A0A438FBD0_VITVI|nr:putative cytosolic oligopeptidase A [Vitis vinifera]